MHADIMAVASSGNAAASFCPTSGSNAALCEEARQPQIGDDDHHAEQQRDGIEVDRLVGILERQ
jgi:hypothetical protein